MTGNNEVETTNGESAGKEIFSMLRGGK